MGFNLIIVYFNVYNLNIKLIIIFNIISVFKLHIMDNFTEIIEDKILYQKLSIIDPATIECEKNTDQDPSINIDNRKITDLSSIDWEKWSNYKSIKDLSYMFKSPSTIDWNIKWHIEQPSTNKNIALIICVNCIFFAISILK